MNQEHRDDINKSHTESSAAGDDEVARLDTRDALTDGNDLSHALRARHGRRGGAGGVIAPDSAEVRGVDGREEELDRHLALAGGLERLLHYPAI